MRTKRNQTMPTTRRFGCGAGPRSVAAGVGRGCAGVPSVLSEDQSGIPAAVKAAKAADTVVLAVGTDLNWSREGHDATNVSRERFDSRDNSRDNPASCALRALWRDRASTLFAKPTVWDNAHEQTPIPSRSAAKTVHFCFKDQSKAQAIYESVKPLMKETLKCL